MRKLALVAGVIAGLVVCVVVVVVAAIDAESVGQEVVRQANGIDGVELSVSDFDLGLFTGLRLGKTAAALDMPSGRVDAELESLTFEHELMPLLRGHVSVKQVRLDRPVLGLVSRESAAGGPGDGAPESTVAGAEPALSVAIKQILVNDGRISASSDDAEGSFECGWDQRDTDRHRDGSHRGGPPPWDCLARGRSASRASVSAE